MDRTTVSEITRLIRLRRNASRPIVLFLGARAGGLFNNPIFYELIELLSKDPAKFQKLGALEKFAECYRILAEQRENDIYGVLRKALEKKAERRREDEYLAQLVKERFFDLIISTNIDSLLERSFERAELNELQDYNVFIAGRDHARVDLAGFRGHCLILKVFGDLETRTYKTAGNVFDIDVDRNLAEYLRSVLSNHLLAVGYDPVWDDPIAAVFPTSTDGIDYVNIDQPLEGSQMASIIRRRRGNYLIENTEEFTKFFQVLYTSLLSNNQLAEQSISLSPTARGVDKRKKVFISYSHRDARRLERLHTHLAMYEREGLVDAWDDTKIAVGADWKEEIKKALQEAKVAVLLISADFLASKFIAENELPSLLEAAKAGGTRIIPVILSPCNYNDSGLHQFQAVNPPSKPLSSMNSNDKEALWMKVVKLINES